MYCESVAMNPRGPAPPLYKRQWGQDLVARVSVPNNAPWTKYKTYRQTYSSTHYCTHPNKLMLAVRQTWQTKFQYFTNEGGKLGRNKKKREATDFSAIQMDLPGHVVEVQVALDILGVELQKTKPDIIQTNINTGVCLPFLMLSKPRSVSSSPKVYSVSYQVSRSQG